MVCPECGEQAENLTPMGWTPAFGPGPSWRHYAHRDPLCPVISTGDGVAGYVSAHPVTMQDFNDANGCPCVAIREVLAPWPVPGCVCFCTACPCAASGNGRIDDTNGGENEGV